MSIAIVWFTTDLRLLDNETLIQAMTQYDEILPVYCFDESHFTTTNFGFKKTGKFRTKFLIESLIDLDDQLRQIGSGLIIVKGKPENELFKIAEKYHVQKVFAKKQVGYEELLTQKKAARALEKINCLFETIDTSTLYQSIDLPFEIIKTPDIFTNFKMQVEKNTNIREAFPKVTHIQSPTIAAMTLPSLSELDMADYEFDARAAIICKGGEKAAEKRVHVFLTETDAIATYKQTRNGLIGENYSSKFSAWLSLGCLSPKVIYQEIKKYEGIHGANESTYWLIFELLWRDYFAFMLKKYPYQYFTVNGIKNSSNIIHEHDKKKFQRWCNGETDNDFINANMIELNLTGFMSNRGRQNVASYLCHDLKLDWRYGAAYFEQQLIDYDVSSNWGNWAYIAGVGNNPRGASVFNIDKQANDYDQNKLYRNVWLKKK